MHLRQIDLNLLLLFDILFRERSVSRAAREMGLSQPAASHALGRLRHMLDDELFVRAPHGMLPTRRAEQLAEPIRQALADINAALQPKQFDPKTSRKRFVMAADNAAAIVLAPLLTLAVNRAAPNIRLDIRPSGTLNVDMLLDLNELDLAIGRRRPVAERFHAEALFDDAFVLVTRPNHPLTRGDISADALARFPLLEISSSGDDMSFYREWLSTEGAVHNQVLRAPYLSATPIILGANVVAVMRHRVAQAMAGMRRIKIFDLPITPPETGTMMQWSRRTETTPAHRWLRDQLRRVSAG